MENNAYTRRVKFGGVLGIGVGGTTLALNPYGLLGLGVGGTTKKKKAQRATVPPRRKTEEGILMRVCISKATGSRKVQTPWAADSLKWCCRLHRLYVTMQHR